MGGVNPSKRVENYFIVCLVLSMALCTSVVVATHTPSQTGFFEFAVLGPQMEASSYPYNVTLSDPIDLWIFVGNRMGTPENLRVVVTITGPSLPYGKPIVIEMQEFSLAADGTTTQPFECTLSKLGFREIGSYRAVFELYGSAQDDSSWSSTGLWLQIWLNASK